MRKQLEASYANRDNNPGLLFREKVAQVNTSGPLHVAAADAGPDRDARPGRDGGVLQGALRQRRRFHPLHGRRLSSSKRRCRWWRGTSASLPSTGKADSQFDDLGVKFPAAIERVTIEKGREPRAQTVVSFSADPPLEENEQTRVVAATDVLEIALRDILREELGETYNVSAGLSQALPQRGGGHIAVSFGASPDNIQTMVERTFEEVKRLQEKGPSADLVNRAKETARREHETALRQNGFWLGRLQSARLLGRDPLLILKREERIAALTPENIQQAFQTYFPLDRYTVVTLLPEKK